jgi:outer membrane scaffolding protein for murein synthesis (MipA/OmpV family)
LGGKYRFQYPGLFLSAGVNLGNSRKPDDVDILEDTAEVSNFATYFVKTGYESGFFDFFITANYYPINMKYNANIPDEKKKGLLYTMSCVTGYPILNNLLVSAEFGCSAMDSDYAKAYYGIKYKTRRLEEYKPDAGLNRVYFEPTVIFFTGYDISINIQGHYERLLGDAAKSPLVKNKNVFTGLLYLSYDI